MSAKFDLSLFKEVYGKEATIGDDYFTISEVIRILERAREKFGDVNVAFQCRDLGGEYDEYDNCLDLAYDKSRKLFLL